MSEIAATVDASGLNCPLPILRTRKAIKDMQAGEVLEVVSTDPGSVKDMASFCEQTGNTLLASNESGERYVFLIRKA
ncbi:MAG TPA: sulfurtransferase TusA family protein [Gammaproteobacteria bacterium]|nr:sulfurtransferase TusA family protein [Gammaproteobacteria bacterium]